MNRCDLVKELLLKFRDFPKTNLKDINELNNIRCEIEKLSDTKPKNSHEGYLINELINIFVHTKHTRELVICLSAVVGAEDLKCSDGIQIKKLLKWLVAGGQGNTNLKYTASILRLYANIVKVDAVYINEVEATVFAEPNVNLLLEGLNQAIVDADFECVGESLHSFEILSTCFLEKHDGLVYLESWTKFGKFILSMHYENSFALATSDVKDKIIFLSLALLAKISTISINFAKTYISELLGVIRAYWHYDHEAVPALIKVLPSQQYFHDEDYADDVNDGAKASGGKVNKKRKPKTATKKTRQDLYNKQTELSRNVDSLFNGLDLKTSESDTSEAELGGSKANHLKKQKFAKIRLVSIMLLGKVMTVQQPNTLCSFWHAIFPNALFKTNINLISIGQTDQNIRCRTAALQVASQLLYLSKPFLRQAETSTKPTNFLPFSASLAMDVILLYEILLQILNSESYTREVVQALKCLAYLVQGTSFEKLQTGLARSVIKSVRLYINHWDSSVQVASLMVLEFTVSSKKLEPEIVKSLGFPLIKTQTETVPACETLEVDLEEEAFTDDEVVHAKELPSGSANENNDAQACVKETSDDGENASFWLINQILTNLLCHENYPAPPVKVASLQVMIALAPHLPLYVNFLENIVTSLVRSLVCSVSDIRLCAARCTDALAYQINQQNSENTGCLIPGFPEKSKIFWDKILPVLQTCLYETKEEYSSSLKVTICDAISNMGETIFEGQSQIAKLNLVSLLSGIAGNEESLVSSAALRALAVFSHFPSMQRDLVFIENVAELALRLRKDTNILARIKATWSLANISDALINNKTELTQSHERLSNDLMLRLLEASFDDCSANDKIRCNAVRTIGNLLRLVTTAHLENHKFRLAIRKCIDKLTESIQANGSAKLKWNSCYAIRNLVCNKQMFYSDLAWQDSVFSTLCTTLVEHQNFKVRINATTVILNIEKREHFGGFYETFWTAILNAIEQSHHLDNYYEYNHRDQLQEQLCLAVTHLLNMKTINDLGLIAKHLAKHKVVFNETWKRVTNRMVPETVAPLLLSIETLHRSLENNETLDMKARNHLSFIISAFQVEQEYLRLGENHC